MAFDQAHEVSLSYAHWGAWAEERLSAIVDSALYLADWRSMVAHGDAMLMAIGVGEDPCAGALVWRIEQDGSRRGLVICAIYCPPIEGVDMTSIIYQLARTVGEAAKVDFLRFWTKRPGLAEKSRRLGFDVSFVCEVPA